MSMEWVLFSMDLTYIIVTDIFLTKYLFQLLYQVTLILAKIINFIKKIMNSFFEIVNSLL